MSNTYNQLPNTRYTSSALSEMKLANKHEQTITSEKHNHEQTILDKNHTQEIKKIKISLGWLGGLFGGKELTALNISGALLILLIIFGVSLSSAAACCSSITLDIKDIWAVITPIITLTLGYIFGNKYN